MTDRHDRILLVDDDSAFRSVYATLLEDVGYTIDQADDRPSAREKFAAFPYSVVLLDLMLPPDGSVKYGIEMLSEFLAKRPDVKVIVISGAGDVNFMLQAVRRGAYDFLTKPADPDVVEVVVQRAVSLARLEDNISRLRGELDRVRPSSAMLGKSPAFQNLLAMAERVAPSDLPVLITGEHGTGKELMARTIHERSSRADKDFIAVNCGALSESLLESTLFGHVKGAFTGASKDRKGLFARAHGGTLFLDELGDMPSPLQVKVLRAVEYGEFIPVGADDPVHVDVRLISATNRDLGAMQAEGAFREDLFWRIRGAEIALPPLRERPEDIELIATHFLNLASSLCPDGRPRQLSPDAVSALLLHKWPGNIRELRHEIQRASVMAGPRVMLEPEDFSFGASFAPRDAGAGGEPETLQAKIQRLERNEIRASLERCGGNRTHVARELGLSRQGLLNKMERYGIE